MPGSQPTAWMVASRWTKAHPSRCLRPPLMRSRLMAPRTLPVRLCVCCPKLLSRALTDDYLRLHPKRHVQDGLSHLFWPACWLQLWLRHQEGGPCGPSFRRPFLHCPPGTIASLRLLSSPMTRLTSVCVASPPLPDPPVLWIHQRRLAEGP